MFAVAIFGLAAIGTISLMNKGLASTQNSLETTMARQEIDAQAEALRFLHNAYMSEPKKAEATELSDVCTNPSSYRDLWKCLVTEYVYPSPEINKTESVIQEDKEFYARTTSAGQSCDDVFRTNDSTQFSLPSKSFVLNPRSLDISGLSSTDDISTVLKEAIVANGVQNTHLTLASTYPRLLYGATADDNFSDAFVGSGRQIVYGDNKKRLDYSEGIWVTGVASPTGVQCVDEDAIRPDYYDFHIQTCWDSTVNNSASTIESTIRLFNPDQVSLTSKKNTITFANTQWNKWDNTCNSPECNHNDSYSGNAQHIDTSDPEGKKIVLTGYGCTPANQGTYIDIAASDTMTVSLNLSVSTFNAHPGGFFLVKLGPINAILDSSHMEQISFARDNRTVQQIPTGASDSFQISRKVAISGYTNVTIILEKSGTHYKGYLQGKEDEFIEFDDTQSENLQLAFWMSHYDHCCDIVYRATASVDITLPALPTEDNGCYRVDKPISDDQTIRLPEDDNPTPDPEEQESEPAPESEPEPESEPDDDVVVEEVTVSQLSGAGNIMLETIPATGDRYPGSTGYVFDPEDVPGFGSSGTCETFYDIRGCYYGGAYGLHGIYDVESFSWPKDVLTIFQPARPANVVLFVYDVDKGLAKWFRAGEGMSSYKKYFKSYLFDCGTFSSYDAWLACLNTKFRSRDWVVFTDGADAKVENPNPKYWIIARGIYDGAGHLRYQVINRFTNTEPASYL